MKIRQLVLLTMILTAFACGKEMEPELSPTEQPLSEKEQLLVGKWCNSTNGTDKTFYADRSYDPLDEFLWYLDANDSLHFEGRAEPPWHITLNETADSLTIVWFYTLQGVWTTSEPVRCD